MHPGADQQRQLVLAPQTGLGTELQHGETLIEERPDEATREAHEMLSAACRFVLDEARQTRRTGEVRDQRPEDRVAAIRREAAASDARNLLDQWCDAPIEHCLIQRLLAREVVVQARWLQARASRDVAHCRAIEASLREQPFSSVENAGTRGAGVGFGHCCGPALGSVVVGHEESSRRMNNHAAAVCATPQRSRSPPAGFVRCPGPG